MKVIQSIAVVFALATAFPATPGAASERSTKWVKCNVTGTNFHVSIDRHESWVDANFIVGFDDVSKKIYLLGHDGEFVRAEDATRWSSIAPEPPCPGREYVCNNTVDEWRTVITTKEIVGGGAIKFKQERQDPKHYVLEGNRRYRIALNRMTGAVNADWDFSVKVYFDGKKMTGASSGTIGSISGTCLPTRTPSTKPKF